MKFTSKIYLTISAILIVAVLVLLLVVYPLTGAVSNASARWLAVEEAIDNLYVDWLSLQASQRFLLQIDQARVNKILIQPNQTLDFILVMEEAIRKAGLRHETRVLTIVNGDDAANKKSILPFQLTLWGSFPQLMTFLNYLDNLPYYARIDVAQVKRVGEGGLTNQFVTLVSGDIQATINLQVYAQ